MSGEIIFDMSAADYHGNTFANEPAISNSIIKTLLTQSPLHAWEKHPALNLDYRPEEPSAAFDLGTAVHSLFLENDTTGIVMLDFPDYRTKAAQEARDYARSLGQIPMLQKHWDEASAVVEAIRAGVSGIFADPRLFVGGRSEVTLVWEEDGLVCKARPDFLHDDHSAIDDLKTSKRSSAPERVTGRVFGMGYDIQAAWYARGLRAITGRECEFRFAFVEAWPPCAVSAYALSPAALTLANQKIDFALGLWRDCLKSNRWPGYPARLMHIEPPTYEETRMYEREYREEGEAA